jgi:copper transport protein
VGLTDGGQGSYVVSFSAVSQDTHPVSGRYTFSVGRPSASVDLRREPTGELGGTTAPGIVLQALGRWLHLLGYALGFGVLGFGLAVLGDPGRRGLLRLCGAGVGLLLVAEPFALAGQVGGLGESSFLDPQTVTEVLGSRFGLLLALRAGAAIMLWSLLGAVRMPGARFAAPLGIGLGVALAALDAVSGHTLRAPLPGSASVPVSALHQMAMATWVGGLAGLVAGWRREDGPVALRRFGRLAVVAVGLLVLSGAALALGHLRSPGDLMATAYGTSLGLKGLAFAGALVFALAGRRGDALPRLWGVEAAGMIVILALAGLLLSLPPPR